MADTDMVKMKLTFWRDGLKPGDVIEIPADEVHRWDGFAKEIGKVAPKPSDDRAIAKTPAQAADKAK